MGRSAERQHQARPCGQTTWPLAPYTAAALSGCASCLSQRAGQRRRRRPCCCCTQARAWHCRNPAQRHPQRTGAARACGPPSRSSAAVTQTDMSVAMHLLPAAGAGARRRRHGQQRLRARRGQHTSPHPYPSTTALLPVAGAGPHSCDAAASACVRVAAGQLSANGATGASGGPAGARGDSASRHPAARPCTGCQAGRLPPAGSRRGGCAWCAALVRRGPARCTRHARHATHPAHAP